ncbi:MAG: polymer-forming cytoskeletal protein [Acidimicrobiia bacterium]|nr:polymer-forming cytoskeletal protein [Acidimicrobiia bacterium]
MFLAALAMPVPVGAISVSGTVVVQSGRVIEEDLFAAGSRVIVDGRIEGDLTVTTRNLIINGVVEGDVNGVAWSIDVQGEVGGSVRAAAWEMDVGGSVGDDVLSFARSLEVDGEVGRDVLLAGFSARQSGVVGGELRGELLWGLYVDGTVAEDIDVGIHRLTITESASVGSAVSWRQGLIGQNIRGWTARTDISPQADLGLVTEVRPIPADLSVRALRLLLQALRFVGLLFTGVFLMFVFPRPTRRATERAWSRPATSFLVGLGLFLFVPVAAVAGLFTVILAPVALLALGLWLFGLFAGAVPALAALGRRITRGRYGLMGSFAVAAVVWRLLRIIPLAGFLIFALVVIWGMGAWAMSLWEGWRASVDPDEVSPEPRAVLVEPGPRMELLGLDVPTSAGADEPPASIPRPPAPASPTTRSDDLDPSADHA